MSEEELFKEPREPEDREEPGERETYLFEGLEEPAEDYTERTLMEAGESEKLSGPDADKMRRRDTRVPLRSEFNKEEYEGKAETINEAGKKLREHYRNSGFMNGLKERVSSLASSVYEWGKEHKKVFKYTLLGLTAGAVLSFATLRACSSDPFERKREEELERLSFDWEHEGYDIGYRETEEGNFLVIKKGNKIYTCKDTEGFTRLGVNSEVAPDYKSDQLEEFDFLDEDTGRDYSFKRTGSNPVVSEKLRTEILGRADRVNYVVRREYRESVIEGREADVGEIKKGLDEIIGTFE